MDSKKIICVLLISTFILSMVLTSPVIASSTNDKGMQVFSYLATEDKPQEKPGRTSPSATVTLQNIPSGDYLLGTVTVIAKATGTNVAHVYYRVDSGAYNLMAAIDSTGRYYADWDTSGLVSLGQVHTLTIKATDSAGNSLATTAPVTVNIVSQPRYELRYEIDCISGYAPSDNVLTYLTGYWRQHAIDVTLTVDERSIADPNGDGQISSEEFWSIENVHNGGPTSTKNGYAYYTSADKWMLYGSYDTNPDVGGYTYMLRTASGGNYIFIAQGMIQDWEAPSYDDIPNHGGEMIVTGHEMGHSIGILVGGREKYDSDYYSIMALMRLENSKYIQPHWYYSQNYWATADLGYYA